MLDTVKIDHRRVFADEMQERIAAVTEAIFTYVTVVNAPKEEDESVDDLEKALSALFDMYLAAGKVVETAVEEVVRVTGNHNMVRGSWSAYRPKLLSVGTLKEIAETEAVIAQFDAEAERVRLIGRTAVAAQDVIEAEIFKIMPEYVWIKHNDLYFGIDTGTWGGYTPHLHVRKSGQELFRLEHRTYYD